MNWQTLEMYLEVLKTYWWKAVSEWESTWLFKKCKSGIPLKSELLRCKWKNVVIVDPDTLSITERILKVAKFISLFEICQTKPNAFAADYAILDALTWHHVNVLEKN